LARLPTYKYKVEVELVEKMPGRHAVSGLTGLLTAGVNNSTVAQGQQDFRKKDCVRSIGIGIGTTLPVFLLLRELHGSHVTKVMRPNKRCPRRSFAQDIFFT
ncbi:hypothetical protein J6590_104385, partial [Homalodisca vitripennis]